MKTGFQIAIVILYAACVAAVIYSVYRKESYYRGVDSLLEGIAENQDFINVKVKEIDERTQTRKRTRKKS